MNVGHGYSLWLLPNPDKPVWGRLQEVIRSLAVVHNTPVFPAHVTLINDVPLSETAMIESTRTLCQQIRPFDIEFHELGSNGTYFQMLFAVAKPETSLMLANLQAREVFHVERPPYFPHMSFAYGDVDRYQVDELAQQLYDQLALPLRVEFAVLELWNTTGPINDWQRIMSVELTPRPLEV